MEPDIYDAMPGPELNPGDVFLAEDGKFYAYFGYYANTWDLVFPNTKDDPEPIKEGYLYMWVTEPENPYTTTQCAKTGTLPLYCIMTEQPAVFKEKVATTPSWNERMFNIDHAWMGLVYIAKRKPNESLRNYMTPPCPAEQQVNGIGQRCKVTFINDPDTTHLGTIIRYDNWHPGLVIILLDEGHVVTSWECNWEILPKRQQKAKNRSITLTFDHSRESGLSVGQYVDAASLTAPTTKNPKKKG